MEIYTVSQITARLKLMMALDDVLADTWMRGEVSNCSGRTASGHIYFTLKDGNSQLRCALFKRDAMRQTHIPRDGNAIVIHGYISLYEQRGELQCYVDMVQPDGVGKLALEFELLKQRLEEEGLFAEERKRPIPVVPRTIGIVTSPGAAAFQDILNVLRRRYPLAQVLLAPTLVQGDSAPPQIVAAIQQLNKRSDVDVIIVARGGGSIEELWAFNDEQVARAVYASRIPVVTGVGHETDFTIVDFVADLRAPTPSAAAELVSPDINDMRAGVIALHDQMYSQLQNRLDEARDQLNYTERRLRLASPAGQIPNWRQNIDGLGNRAFQAFNNRLEKERLRVQAIDSRLKVMNPQQILARGYSILTRAGDASVVIAPGDVTSGDDLRAQLADGEIRVRVV